MIPPSHRQVNIENKAITKVPRNRQMPTSIRTTEAFQYTKFDPCALAGAQS